MQLSVIILNYNVRYFLEQCLQSVQAATAGISSEIIVVDNASADDSCAMITEKFPSVTLIRNTENVGFPGGNNQGAALAKGDYLCILNPDTVVAEDTFTKLIGFAEKQENPGSIGVKLTDGTGRFLRESKRGIPTPWVAFTKFAGLYKIVPKWFGKYYAMHLKPDNNGETEVLTGAFMFLKRSIYEQLGGFDEDCFMYSDDIDLSYRVLQAGYKNYYFSGVSVIHYKGESTLRNRLYLKRFRQAMNFFYKKHFKTSWFFNVFMWIGIQFFSIVKLFQLRSSEKKKYRPENYVLVSDDATLRSALEKKLNQQLTLMDVEALLTNHRLTPKTEIIFDGDCIDYKTIINAFEKLKNKQLTFKIRPKNSAFIIGSNHRDAKGEVIIF